MKSVLVMKGEEIYEESKETLEKAYLGGVLIDSKVWLEG